MTTAAAVRQGFVTIRRAPALLLAEIAWRWTFTVAAVFLSGITLAEYLRSLRVTDADLALLRSHQPVLIAEAVLDIVQGSGPRLLRAVVILLPALAVLWTFAAAVGRAATLQFLAPHISAGNRRDSRAFFSVLSLTFLRMIVTLAAAVSFFGAAVVVGALAPASERPAQQVNHLVLLFLLLAILVVCVWSALNWFLSLAPIFAAQGGSALAALAHAVALFQRRASALLGVTSMFALLHVAALAGAFLITLFAIATGQQSPVATGIAVVSIALAYFACADLLYLARLAAWVAVVREDQVPNPAEQVVS